LLGTLGRPGRSDPVIGRLVSSVDFERVLRTPPRARTAHFAIHHVAAGPQPAGRPLVPELSTGDAPDRTVPVDDSCSRVSGLWLGAVVPKRHAKRSVTRMLIKRQIRRSFGSHEAALAAGLWVVRLRAPFDAAAFRSAASEHLRDAAGAELDAALAQAAARAAGAKG
jgi:ribonuclease P protein component